MVRALGYEVCSERRKQSHRTVVDADTVPEFYVTVTEGCLSHVEG
jgi:hypothetical protein